MKEELQNKEQYKIQTHFVFKYAENVRQVFVSFITTQSLFSFKILIYLQHYVKEQSINYKYELNDLSHRKILVKRFISIYNIWELQRSIVNEIAVTFNWNMVDKEIRTKSHWAKSNCQGMYVYT